MDSKVLLYVVWIWTLWFSYVITSNTLSFPSFSRFVLKDVSNPNLDDSWPVRVLVDTRSTTGRFVSVPTFSDDQNVELAKYLTHERVNKLSIVVYEKSVKSQASKEQVKFIWGPRVYRLNYQLMSPSSGVLPSFDNTPY